MPLDLSVIIRFQEIVLGREFLETLVAFSAHHLPYVTVLFFFGWLVVDRRRRTFQFLGMALGAGIAARVLAEAVKFSVARERPFSMSEDVIPLISAGGGSFPSGHATFFFALAAAIWTEDRRAGAVFFLFAALISLARVAAGVHYLSDVVAGAVLGIVVGYVVKYAAGNRRARLSGRQDLL